MNAFIENMLVACATKYIEFVYATSKINYVNSHYFPEKNAQRMIVTFWHGDTYCLYPSLKNHKLMIITTSDKRGDYIAQICYHFKYKTLRVPDESDGQNHLLNIRRNVINDEAHLVLAADGPLGPYHIPKDFLFVTAQITKRQLMPIKLDIKHKITIKKRWDLYKIPLPFNKITITFNEPIMVTKTDRQEKYSQLRERLRKIME